MSSPGLWKGHHDHECPVTFFSVDISGRIHWLALRRSHAGNALNRELSDAFADAVSHLLTETEQHILVIAAEGTQFCVGGDVQAVAAAADPARYLDTLAATMHDALEPLPASPHLVMAVVQGAASRVGLALALNADLMTASDRAAFLSAYASVGLTPDCGISRLLPKVIGPRRAVELALTGRVLSAHEAQEWGMVNVVAPLEELEASVEALVGRLAAGPVCARSRTSGLLKRNDRTYREHFDAELDGLAAQIVLADTTERIHRCLSRSKDEAVK